MARKIAPSDEAMVEIIASLWVELGRQPQVREMAAAIGLASPSPMHRHLLRLRKAGYLTWEDGRPGTLRMLPERSPE